MVRSKSLRSLANDGAHSIDRVAFSSSLKAQQGLFNRKSAFGLAQNQAPIAIHNRPVTSRTIKTMRTTPPIPTPP